MSAGLLFCQRVRVGLQVRSDEVRAVGVGVNLLWLDLPPMMVQEIDERTTPRLTSMMIKFFCSRVRILSGANSFSRCCRIVLIVTRPGLPSGIMADG